VSAATRVAAGLIAPFVLCAGSFWLASIRYVGLDSASWLAIAVVLGALSILWFYGVWQRRGLLWAALGWLTCFAVGELPWRLNSRGRLDWLWSLLDSYPSDAQKIVAIFCWQASPYVLGVLIFATCVEGTRAIRDWRSAGPNPATP
jgi:hypothetical protein